VSPLLWGRRVRRRRDGRFEIRLPASERQLLALLPAEIEGALGRPDPPPSLHRLFPPAYPDDPASDRTYQDLMRADLLEHHRHSLRTLASTNDATDLDDEAMACWLSALNDLRLVLGTTLGVTEDEEQTFSGPEDLARYQAYLYLSHLVTEVVDAMTEALPDPVEAGDDEPLLDSWGEPPEGLRWSAPAAPTVNAPGADGSPGSGERPPEGSDPSPDEPA
jgi:Domain of unknown function (DUF2017)